MLKQNRKLFWLATALLFVGISFLVFPAYSRYCDSNEANNYYCTAYSIAVALGHAVQKYNGAITAIATAIIGIFTATLYSISKSQLTHSHQVERAYVSGGGAPETRVVDAPIFGSGLVTVGSVPPPPTKMRVNTGNFELHINNYGKTPGELWRVGVNWCEADSIPPLPNYLMFDHHDWFGPGTMSRPIRLLAIPNMKSPVIYGRFFYRDIFGANHSSGFINGLGESKSESTPLLAPAAYTEERNES